MKCDFCEKPCGNDHCPAIKQISITQEEILDWLGTDSDLYELANILADIANGGYKIDEFRSDVYNYRIDNGSD